MKNLSLLFICLSFLSVTVSAIQFPVKDIFGQLYYVNLAEDATVDDLRVYLQGLDKMSPYMKDMLQERKIKILGAEGMNLMKNPETKVLEHLRQFPGQETLFLMPIIN